MDGFAVALLAGVLLILTAGVWLALEGLLPHLAASRDWPDAMRARRVRAMRRTIALTALTLWLVPVLVGLLGP